MKFLLLAALPVALQALKQFKNPDELVKCIIDCEEHVTPCIKDEDSACFKAYRICVNHEDPFTCLTSSNSAEVAKIA